MTGKTDIFPVQNGAACVFKWGWNTFRAYNGTSSSCHRVVPVKVDLKNFDNFHNTQEVINDRELMMQGQWPQGRGCEYCKRVEDQGGTSDRIYHNKIPGLTPKDFKHGATVATPSISEIYLNNTCDLACVYCLPIFSSRINQELKSYGAYPIGINAVDPDSTRQQYVDAYCLWLQNNIGKLTRLSILGGEPLIQKELWQILDIVQQSHNPDLELSINSNLNAASSVIEKFVVHVKKLTAKRHIKQVHISASLDCWGPQAEFVRHGLDIHQWWKNLQYLASHRWIALSVHQVITALTIKTAHQLQIRLAALKKIYPKILQEYYLVDGGQEKIYHPEIFGASFFAADLKQLYDTYPVTTEWDQNCRQRLEGIVQLMNHANVDTDRLTMLKQTLDQIDHRRGTDWKSLWPEIDEFFCSKAI